MIKNKAVWLNDMKMTTTRVILVRFDDGVAFQIELLLIRQHLDMEVRVVASEEYDSHGLTWYWQPAHLPK